jgi:hypothetical protein
MLIWACHLFTYPFTYFPYYNFLLPNYLSICDLPTTCKHLYVIFSFPRFMVVHVHLVPPLSFLTTPLSFLTKGVQILFYLIININIQYVSFDYTHVHFDQKGSFLVIFD